MTLMPNKYFDQTFYMVRCLPHERARDSHRAHFARFRFWACMSASGLGAQGHRLKQAVSVEAMSRAMNGSVMKSEYKKPTRKWYLASASTPATHISPKKMYQHCQVSKRSPHNEVGVPTCST